MCSTVVEWVIGVNPGKVATPEILGWGLVGSP